MPDCCAAAFSGCGAEATLLAGRGASAVAFLVAERDARASVLWHTGLAAPRLVGWNPCSLHWQADS